MNALVAMGMPGPGTVFVTQNWTLPKPVYGDTIRIEAAVMGLYEGRPKADQDFVIKNQIRGGDPARSCDCLSGAVSGDIAGVYRLNSGSV